MARLRHLMTDRDRAKSRRSRRRPRPGWYLWPATRPRSTAIRMNCGRHGFWPAMRASADRRRVTNVSPVWLKAPCASFSVKRKSSRTRCATIWNAATPSSSPRWRKFWCVYRGVQVLAKAAAKAEKSKKPVAIVSYDEKPGIQAIASRRHRICRQCQAAMRASRGIMSTNAMARSARWPGSICSPARSTRPSAGAPPQPRVHRIPQASRCRLSGQHQAIKLRQDPRQSSAAHISRETRAWLDTRPPGRFDFTFTTKHGSRLNLIEGFSSPPAPVLRHIRVTSKHELKQRIMAGIDDVNRHPATLGPTLAEAA